MTSPSIDIQGVSLAYPDRSDTGIVPILGRWWRALCRRDRSPSGVPILHNFSMSLQAGKIHVLMGNNGSGKSTLLKLILGALAPQSGTIKIGTHGDRNRLDCDWMPQDFRKALFPWKTVRKNLTPWTTTESGNLDVSDGLRRVVGLLEIEHLLHRLPCDLSGGQQQRTMIGRMLLSCPELIVMDEPFSEMDEVTKISLMEMLREYWRLKKPTIVVALHEPSCAAKLGDCIWTFRGPPLQLHSAIEHPDPIEAERQIRQSLNSVEPKSTYEKDAT